ncbi:PQQ-binding-like beta-propeller repeat protein [Sphingomonas sp. ASV193]|uniref:outer membrane protein assembly factor BamB family protein n=1 Tax=Sphingomonas sp. ASV193 TaxID=3144405 RepID=UPI0032E86A5C
MSHRRAIALTLSLALLGGCSVIHKGKPRITPTVGERIDVLTNDIDYTIDPATMALPYAPVEAVANADWGQPGGNAQHLLQAVALPDRVSQAWSVSIGQGNAKGERLGAGPVVAGGKVFTIDTQSVVKAFDVRNGGLLWSRQFGTEKRGNASLYGGGVSTDGTHVYATNGLGFVTALDAATGKALWQVKPGGPLRGAPTLDNGAVYVTSQDSQLYALDAGTGKTNWNAAAAVEIAAVFGAGSPASGRGTIIAGFPSGDLNAYRYENGREVWQDALTRTSMSTGVADLSDIDASPVIDDNMVYAFGLGGRLVALDILSGQRTWELPMGGIATPWVSGDWLFAINDKAQVVSVNRTTGKIRWIRQLPKWANEKKKSGQVFYVGPVLAGNRLIVTGTNGALISVDPASGNILGQQAVLGSVRFQPVVAGGTLYLLTDTGRLLAYR